MSGWGVLGVLASLILTENWSASSLFSLFYGHEEGSNQDTKQILHLSQVKLPASLPASLPKIPFTTTMTNSLTTDLHSAANNEGIEESTNTQALKHPIMMLSTISVK